MLNGYLGISSCGLLVVVVVASCMWLTALFLVRRPSRGGPPTDAEKTRVRPRFLGKNPVEVA